MRKFLSLALILTLILSLTAFADAAKKEKVKFNKRQLKKIELVAAPAQGLPMIVLREDYSDVPVRDPYGVRYSACRDVRRSPLHA